METNRSYVISIIMNVINKVTSPLKSIQRSVVQTTASVNGLRQNLQKVDFKKAYQLQSEFSRVKSGIDSASSAVSLHNSKVKEAVKEISSLQRTVERTSDLEVRSIQRVQRETSKLTRILERVKKRWKEVKTEAEGAFKDLAVSYGAFRVAGFAASVTESFIQPAADIQTALGQVSSVGVKNLKLLTETAMKVSSQWSGITAPEFISAAYDIKSAISTLSDEGVAKYTEFAAITAKATKATVGEMTNLLAVGYGIFKKQLYKDMSDIKFGELFSAEIAKAVQLFRTTGSQMREAVKNLGATASQLGVSMSEQLAVLGILQQTMEGAEAGTSYKYFIQSIISASDKLGIVVTDANGKLLSTVQIIEELKRKFGERLTTDTVDRLRKALGSEEAVRTLMLLWNKTDQLREGMQALSKAGQEGMASVKSMAEKMNSGFNEQLQLLRQNLSNLKAAVGLAVIPLVLPFIRVITKVLNFLALLQSSHPVIAKTTAFTLLFATGIATLIGTFLAIKGAIHVARLSFLVFKEDLSSTLRVSKALTASILRNSRVLLSDFKTSLSLAARGTRELTVEIIRQGKVLLSLAYQKAVSGLILLKRGFFLAASAVRFLTLSLLTNPIVLAVAGIAVAALLIYRYWGKIKPFFSSLWSSVREAFSKAVSFIRRNWKKLLEFLLAVNPITAPIIAFKKLHNFLKSQSLYKVGRDLILGLGKGMLSGFTYPLKVAKEGASAIISKVKGIFGIKSPSRVFSEIGSFLTKGLSVGIKFTVPEAVATVEELFKSVIGKAQKFQVIRTAKNLLQRETIFKNFQPPSHKPQEIRKEGPVVKQFISKVEIHLNLPKGTDEKSAKFIAKKLEELLKRKAMEAELDYDFS